MMNATITPPRNGIGRTKSRAVRPPLRPTLQTTSATTAAEIGRWTNGES